MKIYCIDNTNSKLTLGKEYNAERMTKDEVFIRLDDDMSRWYKSDRFTLCKYVADNILDRKENPDNYYNPISLTVTITEKDGVSKVHLKVNYIDKALLGVGDLFEFINKLPVNDIIINSSSKYISYNKTSMFLHIGKEEFTSYETEIASFNSNFEAIKFAYDIGIAVESLNNKLKFIKKEKKLAYLVEHEPNGKRYLFRGQELYIHELVHCDTSRGLQYGVIVGTEMIDGGKWNQLKECRHIYKTDKEDK